MVVLGEKWMIHGGERERERERDGLSHVVLGFMVGEREEGC